MQNVRAPAEALPADPFWADPFFLNNADPVIAEAATAADGLAGNLADPRVWAEDFETFYQSMVDSALTMPEGMVPPPVIPEGAPLAGETVAAELYSEASGALTQHTLARVALEDPAEQALAASLEASGYGAFSSVAEAGLVAEGAPTILLLTAVNALTAGAAAGVPAAPVIAGLDSLGMPIYQAMTPAGVLQAASLAPISEGAAAAEAAAGGAAAGIAVTPFRLFSGAMDLFGSPIAAASNLFRDAQGQDMTVHLDSADHAWKMSSDEHQKAGQDHPEPTKAVSKGQDHTAKEGQPTTLSTRKSSAKATEASVEASSRPTSRESAIETTTSSSAPTTSAATTEASATTSTRPATSTPAKTAHTSITISIPTTFVTATRASSAPSTTSPTVETHHTGQPLYGTVTTLTRVQPTDRCDYEGTKTVNGIKCIDVEALDVEQAEMMAAELKAEGHVVETGGGPDTPFEAKMEGKAAKHEAEEAKKKKNKKHHTQGS